MSFTATANTLYENLQDATIKSITVSRTPILKSTMALLNTFSGGDFLKRLEKQPYDDLFHLRMIINTSKGKVMTEKNENVVITSNIPKREKNTESIEIQIPSNLTFGNLIDNTIAKIGKLKFFKYSVFNNCQMFVMNILNSNGLNKPEYEKFIKQDVKELFRDKPYFRKFVNTVSDVGAVVDKKVQLHKDNVNRLTNPRRLVKDIAKKPSLILNFI